MAVEGGPLRQRLDGTMECAEGLVRTAHQVIEKGQGLRDESGRLRRDLA